MKKIIVVLSIIAILLMASPVSAARHVYAGDRINVLLLTPTTFEADTPFHINHGWGIQVGRDTSGTYKEIAHARFELEVDGVLVGEDFVDRYVDSGFHAKYYVFNFFDGLPAGDHTFTGHWYNLCKYSGVTCTNPSQEVENLVQSLTVTFTAAP
jgi:hypothetical protein